MTKIYDVLIKHHSPYWKKDEIKYTCVFYDENRREALKAMQEYVKKHGFTTPDKKNSIATVVLREREYTGKEINVTPYHELFDVITGILKEKVN